MLRRSQSAANAALLTQAFESQGLRSTTAKPKRRPEFDNTTATTRVDAVKTDFETRHSYPPRTEQTEAFMHLLEGRPTILLAGTGFGKSRVPEMYFHAYDHENYSPIVLCINPLVSLGNDQVSEKEAVGLKAINLEGGNCTKESCNAILQGKYHFVYVSPEIALTNDIFDQMWRDQRFQSRLILKVVDEAHMIYEWGLVASGQAKRLASHTRVQDVGVFRPSYGDLIRRFLATDTVPLLMMSATLTPQAIDAILANLKLEMGDIGFVRAELSRPEIRLIRRAFKRPLKSSLRGLFTHHTSVPTSSIPPTLLYAGTQNATLDFLQLINCSRGQPNETANGFSEFARRYHASTGEKAKLSAVEAFVSGSLAVMCCTLALGLGQNWHRVRRVAVLGRQDPCNFIQMAGRCGRDGRPGLGLLLVEHKRLHGKNLISDFKAPTRMTDDDRMDALAITPVCLRVALAVDLKYGYIPLDEGNWTVTEETARQHAKGMPACLCSNCKPEEAEALWLAQGLLTNENFDDVLRMDETALYELINAMPEPPPSVCTNSRAVAFTCPPGDDIRGSTVLQTLVTTLESNFNGVFGNFISGPSDLGPADFFGTDLAWDVAKNIDLLSQAEDLATVLTGKAIPGQFECLFRTFKQWQSDFDTVSVLAEAIKRRATSCRLHGPSKAPQSVEGAQIALARSEADKEARRVIKEARKVAKDAEKVEKEAQKVEKEKAAQAQKVEKEKAAQAKLVEKELAAQAKLAEKNARDQIRKAKKGEAQKGAVVPNSSKRAANDSLKASDSKRRISLQDVTPLLEHHRSPKTPGHLPLPNDNAKIDPRLYQTEST